MTDRTPPDTAAPSSRPDASSADRSVAAPAPVADLPYAAAVEELEAILESLEGDEPDVDHLAQSVARAAELIRECRSRIAGTRFEVERIVADLHAGGPGGAADAEER